MAKAARLKGKGRSSAKARVASIVDKYGEIMPFIKKEEVSHKGITIYKPEHNRLIFWLALAGMTEYEMANVLGIPDVTFAQWKQRRPDFMKAMQAGRAEAVGVAAHSLFRLATGYTHEAVKLIPNRIKIYNPDTGKIVKEYTEILEHPYTKHYAPNGPALFKFLAAKYPGVWGDRSEVVHSGVVSHSIDASKLTKKQLKTLKAIAQSGHKPEDETAIKPVKSEKKADKAAKKLKKSEIKVDESATDQQNDA